MTIYFLLAFGTAIAFFAARSRQNAVWQTIFGVALFASIVGIATHSSQTPSAQADAFASSRSAPTTDPGQHYCTDAEKYVTAAVTSYNGNAYQDAYKNAVSGLARNENCDDENDKLVNQAYLLSVKGLSEHHLSVGDSRTDLNQADMLLEQCITKPGLYATQVGAGCETQQHNNIHDEDNWDLGE